MKLSAERAPSFPEHDVSTNAAVADKKRNFAFCMCITIVIGRCIYRRKLNMFLCVCNYLVATKLLIFCRYKHLCHCFLTVSILFLGMFNQKNLALTIYNRH